MKNLSKILWMVLALCLGRSATAATNTFTFSPTATPTFTPTATPTSTYCVPITLDASSSTTSAATQVLFEHVMGTQANRALVVGIGLNPGSSVVSSVYYNGVTMTQGVSHIAVLGNQILDLELWYLLNPATGAHNIEINQTGASYFVAGGVSYYGVNAVGNTNSTDNGPGTSIALNFTTAANASKVVYMVGQNSSTTSITHTDASVQRWSQAFGFGEDAVTGEQGDLDTTFAGIQGLGFAMTESAYNDLVALELQPLCNAAFTATSTPTWSPTVSPTATNTPNSTPTSTYTTSPTLTATPTPTISNTITQTPTTRATVTAGANQRFSASIPTATYTTARNVVAGLFGSDTKDVRFRISWANGANTANIQPSFSLLRVSSRPTGGGPVALAMEPKDSDTGVATAYAVEYGSDPTVVGTSRPVRATMPTVYNATTSTADFTWNYDDDGLDFVLHGSQDGIILSFNGAQLTNFNWSVEWLEGVLQKKTSLIDFDGTQPVRVVNSCDSESGVTCTNTPTATSTFTPTWTQTTSPTRTRTSTFTFSPTRSPTLTTTPTWTPTTTASASSTPNLVFSICYDATLGATCTPGCGAPGNPCYVMATTYTPSFSPTITQTFTFSPTGTPTATPTPTPTATYTATSSWTNTASPSWTPTGTNTASPTWTTTATMTWTWTQTATPTWTQTPTASASQTQSFTTSPTPNQLVMLHDGDSTPVSTDAMGQHIVSTTKKALAVNAAVFGQDVSTLNPYAVNSEQGYSGYSGSQNELQVGVNIKAVNGTPGAVASPGQVPVQPFQTLTATITPTRTASPTGTITPTWTPTTTPTWTQTLTVTFSLSPSPDSTTRTATLTRTPTATPTWTPTTTPSMTPRVFDSDLSLAPDTYAYSFGGNIDDNASNPIFIEFYNGNATKTAYLTVLDMGGFYTDESMQNEMTVNCLLVRRTGASTIASSTLSGIKIDNNMGTTAAAAGLAVSQFTTRPTTIGGGSEAFRAFPVPVYKGFGSAATMPSNGASVPLQNVYRCDASERCFAIAPGNYFTINMQGYSGVSAVPKGLNMRGLFEVVLQ